MNAVAPPSLPERATAIFENGTDVEAKHPKHKKWRRGRIIAWCAETNNYKLFFRGLPKEHFHVKKAHVRADKAAVKKEENTVVKPVETVDLTLDTNSEDDVIPVETKEHAPRQSFADYEPYQDGNMWYLNDYYYRREDDYAEPKAEPEAKSELPPTVQKPLTEAEKRAKDQEMEAAMLDSHPSGFAEDLKKKKDFFRKREEAFYERRKQRLNRKRRGFMTVGNEYQLSRDRVRELRKAQEERRRKQEEQEEEKKKKRRQKQAQKPKRMETEEIRPAVVQVLSETESDSSTEALSSSPEPACGSDFRETRQRASANVNISSRKRIATDRDPAPSRKRVERPSSEEIVEVVDHESLAKNISEARLSEAVASRELRQIERRKAKLITVIESSEDELPQTSYEPCALTIPSSDVEEELPSKYSQVPKVGPTLTEAAEAFRAKVKKRIEQMRGDDNDKVEMANLNENDNGRKYNLRPRGLLNRVEQIDEGIDYWKVHLDVWLGELLHIHNGRIENNPTSSSNSPSIMHVSTSTRKTTPRKNAGYGVVRLWKEVERFTTERFNSLKALVRNRHAQLVPSGSNKCVCTCNENDTVLAPWMRLTCVQCKGYIHAWCSGIRDTARWNKVLCVKCAETGHLSDGLKAALPSITNPLLTQRIRRVPHKKDELEAGRQRRLSRARAARVDLPLDEDTIEGMCKNLENLRIGRVPESSFRDGVLDRIVRRRFSKL